MATVPSTPISVKLPLSPVLPTDRLIGLRTPQNQPDPTQRLGPVSYTDVATAVRPLLNLTTNNLPGTDKRVRFLSAAQLAGAADGGDCLDGLNPATLVLGGLAWVEFHPLGYGTTLRLLYDGAARTPAGSGLYAFRTGDMVAGDTVPVRWVVATGPEVGVVAYPQRPAGYVFTLNELVRAYVSDVPTEQFFAANFATALPAPTVSAGDVNWRAVSGTALPAAVAPLYGTTGTNTNGAMTQAATTTALGRKLEYNDIINNFSVITYFQEISNPALVYGPTTARGFQTTAGSAYFFSDPATRHVYQGSNIFYGTIFSFRLSAAATSPMPLVLHSTGGNLTLSLAPGESLQAAQLPSIYGASDATPLSNTTWVVLNRSLPPAVFTAITQNQYGTHPAFSTQTALNAYLLGGAATVPTITTPTFTAA